MKTTVCAAALAAVLAPLGAHADTLGNVGQGQAYARVHCAECHAVEPAEDMSPTFDATPFPIVANTPGMTERALAVWLQTSHPTMPNFIIPDDVRDDLIAYIMSLKAVPPQ